MGKLVNRWTFGLGAYAATTVVVGIAAGLGWGTFLGALGTAVGTLGLAFYSYRSTLASQALEGTALDTLKATQEQATAAAAAARGAERARVDALAPIIDLQVVPRDEWYRRLDDPGQTTRPLRTKAGEGWTYAEVDGGTYGAGTFGVRLDFHVTNFGKTTAFVEFKPASFLPSPREVLRVAPGATETVSGDSFWRSGEDWRPDRPRPVQFEAEIRGPLTEGTTDTLTWEGEITMLRRVGTEWRLTTPSVIRMTAFQVRRVYPGDQVVG